MMTEKYTVDQENFLCDLQSKINDADQFNALVRFGLPTLLENQAFFMELLCREAERRLKHKPKSWKISDAAREVFKDLGLRIVMADARREAEKELVEK